MTEVNEGESPHDPSVKANKTAKKIQTSLNILIATTAVLFGLAIAGFIWVYGFSNENTKSLCALRANAQDRITQSEEFLKEHPEGFAGISAAEIQRGNITSQKTVDALDSLGCPPPISPK